MRLSKKHVTVIKMLAYTGSSKREVALTNGISEQTLYNWLRDESFKSALEDFRERYVKSMREYSENNIDRDRLYSLLGIGEDEAWLIREIVDEGLARPGLSNEFKVRMDKLLEKSLAIVEKRIDDNTADSTLLNFLLEKLIK
ncbi:MAG: hypothetical protein A2015_01400 [Spirochaetes bacterium GWF1_31_7]|nr:MAG: hypothetical protein A2Y30_07990 [Spirochaetes bacterium GWE1_32_154]OHD47849.1 MAG: hypothetical protein A2015_01400 [Spirochaetes bacterium GWF1_31_7]OHD52210.1 MAG: hypothetical protein A2Y29_17635 [Spirochaetes bacterium GWE2_31_10]OHD82696.1 MAG: hypothetical protein A2355_08230 [Spirochaetes bacterium RIFOXYB1_FULL_32_8]HBD96378.1 hypothetical protein [Spirochaetia bacterium]